MLLVSALWVVSLVVFLESFFGGALAASDVDVHSRWGTLRPNVYMGARAEFPGSPLFGLMWYNPDDVKFYDHIRHDCDVRDEMDTFGWLEHNGDSYGHQLFLDGRLGVNITTSFVQTDKASWALKVHARRYKSKKKELYADGGPAKSGRIGLLWYVACPTTGEVSTYSFDVQRHDDKDKGSVEGVFEVNLGDHFTFSALAVQKKKSKSATPVTKTKTFFEGFHRASPEHWNVKESFKERIQTIIRSAYMKQVKKHKKKNQGVAKSEQEKFEFDWQIPTLKNKLKSGLKGKTSPNPNIVIFQQFHALPVTVYIALTPFGAPVSSQEWLSSPAAIDSQLTDAHLAFCEKFARTFPIADKEDLTTKHERLAQAAVSNMLGGIGYFAGDTVVQEGRDARPRLTQEKVLFSAVPSRSFFPRGFLWDEGFHQLLISQWDVQLSMKIISSWFRQMRHDGWIPREQIMGGEGRSRVPAEFQVQRPHVANPPTLFAAVRSVVHQYEELLLQENRSPVQDTLVDAILAFMNEVGPKLQTHLEWFVRTQGVRLPHHEAAPNSQSFSWKGRTLDHCLGSGLDDYPRAPWLSDEEAHVDLHSWIMFMYRVSGDIQTKLLQPAAQQHLRALSQADPSMAVWEIDATKIEENHAQYAKLSARLDDLFWSEEGSLFCDWIEHVNATSHHVCHAGYISLFPLLNVQIDPRSDKLGAVLELLRDERHIWSEYGLLSLSKSSSLFHSKEDYWRGNIWMNINYLAVRALHHYGHTEGPHAARALEIYGELRTNLIANLHNNFFSKGYLYEQYVAETGEGIKSHPFTGWSSLIVLIQAEHYY